MTLLPILRQILHKLPVIPLSIIKVNPLPVRMHIPHCRIPVSRRRQSITNPLRIIHFIRKMIHTRHATIKLSPFPFLLSRLIQHNIRLIRPNMNPTRPIRIGRITPNPKFRKRRLQKTNHPVNIPNAKIHMFKSSGHFSNSEFNAIKKHSDQKTKTNPKCKTPHPPNINAGRQALQFRKNTLIHRSSSLPTSPNPSYNLYSPNRNTPHTRRCNA